MKDTTEGWFSQIYDFFICFFFKWNESFGAKISSSIFELQSTEFELERQLFQFKIY